MQEMTCYGFLVVVVDMVVVDLVFAVVVVVVVVLVEICNANAGDDAIVRWLMRKRADRPYN